MKILRVPGGGEYCFTDEEIKKIHKCKVQIMEFLKGRGLTFAEVLEILEQCKASVNELLVK